MFAKSLIFFYLSSFIFASCIPTAQPPKEVVNVYATSGAQYWLTELYVCANDSSVVLNVNANEPDITLRVGEPENFIFPAYKIDEEEILIVTNRESAIQNLTLDEAQALFAQGDPSAQVWVYASDADVQMSFDQLVMQGRSITSFAKLAVNPQEMFDILNADKNAVGILPRHWKVDAVRDVFSAGVVPVLAVTKETPSATVLNLIACLQR